MEIPTLNSPNCFTFSILFLAIYLFAYHTIFRNWAPPHRLEASSCLISLAHGTPAVFMALLAVSQPQLTISSPNTTTQNTVLEFSIAYFFIDLLHYTFFFPHDTLFILHHLATLYVFVTCRYVLGCGAYAILVLLILAEGSSACQNIWSLAGFRKADDVVAEKLYELLCPLFYGLYSVLRGVLGPMFVYRMGVFYLSGEGNGLVPVWAWVSWMVVIVVAILVSNLWVFNHWVNWFEERSRTAAKKVR